MFQVSTIGSKWPEFIGVWGFPNIFATQISTPGPPLTPQVLCRGKVREIFAHVEARFGHSGLGLLRRMRVLPVDHFTNGAEYGECFHQDEGRTDGGEKWMKLARMVD